MKITESKPIPPSLSYSNSKLKYRNPIKAEGITKPKYRTEEEISFIKFAIQPINLFAYVLVIGFIIFIFFI